MPFWTPELNTLHDGIYWAKGDTFFDAIISLLVFSYFSVLQLQVIFKVISRHRNERSESSRPARVLGVINVLLAAGFIAGTILLLINFAAKIDFVAKSNSSYWHLYSVEEESCPNRSPYSTYPDQAQCLSVLNFDWDKAMKRAYVKDLVNATLFHFEVIVSDALLVYRCCVMLVSPWRWIVVFITCVPLLGATAVSIFMLQSSIRSSWYWSLNSSGYEGEGQLVATYVSLASNLVLSATLIARIWLARREVKRLLRDAHSSKPHIPYAKLISILLESAFPPLVLGVSHFVIWKAFNRIYYTHGALWLSFTIFAPQTLAVRAMEQRSTKQGPGAVSQVPTRPIAFRGFRSFVSSQTSTSRVGSITVAGATQPQLLPSLVEASNTNQTLRNGSRSPP